jgi:hypothetical protein
MNRKVGYQIAVVLLAVTLLAGTGFIAAQRPRADDAQPFHQAVYELAQTMPRQIGNWYGTDIEPPQAAIKLLKPNIIVSRTYANSLSGQQISFLLVQCKDARDMVGHYPPRCYRAHGWTEESATPTQWQAGDLLIDGTEYVFFRQLPSGTLRMNVANVLILPNGKFSADMAGVQTAEADYTRRFHGVAQMQLLDASDANQAQRRKVFEQFIRANRHMIELLLSGHPQDNKPRQQPLSR